MTLMSLKTLMSLMSFLPLRLFLRFSVAAVEGIDGEVSICTRTNAVTTACRTYPLARPLDIRLKINAVTTPRRYMFTSWSWIFTWKPVQLQHENCNMMISNLYCKKSSELFECRDIRTIFIMRIMVSSPQTKALQRAHPERDYIVTYIYRIKQ